MSIKLVLENLYQTDTDGWWC